MNIETAFNRLVGVLARTVTPTKGGKVFSDEQSEALKAMEAAIQEAGSPQPAPNAEAFQAMKAALETCAQALKDHVQYDNGESLERDGYNAARAALKLAEKAELEAQTRKEAR